MSKLQPIVTATDFHKNPIKIDPSKLKWRPAAYAVIIKNGKILLLKQINGYDLPGGGIKIGETPEQALSREIKEETGVTAVNPRLVDCGTAYFKAYNHNLYYQAIALYYQCDYINGRLSKEGFDEDEKEFAEQPVWLDLKELDNMEMGSYREFRDVVKKVLS